MELSNSDCPKLLQFLKTTVEGLLVSQVRNVWNVYGGLNRLHFAVEKIFEHGCKTNSEGISDCWKFIEGLSKIQPFFLIEFSKEGNENLPENIKNNRSLIWIYKTLQDHLLSDKLSWLLSDSQHLAACYEENSFLRNKKYADAAILCLQAVEKKQPSLLIEIDPSLYISDLSHEKFNKHHQRCRSFPEGKYHFLKNLDDIKPEAIQDFQSNASPCKFNDLNLKNTSKKNSVTLEVNIIDQFKLHSSLPNLILKRSEEPILKITSNNQLSDNLFVSYSTPNNASPPDNFFEPIPAVELENYGKRKACHQKNDNKEWFVIQGKKKAPKRTFMQDGGTSVLPMSTGYYSFPRPIQGQSLTSFLSSEHFSRKVAELDRENAHFSVSEAMISAIEQIKCNRQLKLVEEINDVDNNDDDDDDDDGENNDNDADGEDDNDDEDDDGNDDDNEDNDNDDDVDDDDNDDSDGEISQLKQKMRLRKRQRFEEKRLKHLWSTSLLSDGKTDTTTDQSVSPFSTSPESPSGSLSTDDPDDFEVKENSHFKCMKNSKISVSMASLYSKADVFKIKKENSESAVNAENVALLLLKQFKKKQLPRASDLEWLVSKEDAPQELLPLPKSWPISPDDAEQKEVPFLRGTSDWAPPRPQVIFTQHPTPTRRSLLSKQNFRCAGCGLRVAAEYSHKFRYCEYLGRYFCTGCHSNQLSIIPGHILFKWNFKRYPVSTFSYKLIDQMSPDPLFSVKDLNPSLYGKIKMLEKTRILRMQLFYLKDFLFTCRFAQQLQSDIEKEPFHIFQDPEMYSLQDFIRIKTGELVLSLKELVKDCLSHVEACQLCSERGFICELCPSKEPIFPWFIDKVSRCPRCGACYHVHCFKSGFCPRCARASARRQCAIDGDF